MNRLKSNRGEITVYLLVVLATVLVVGKPASTPGKDYWWQFWRKNPIEQVQKLQAELDKVKAEQEGKIKAAEQKIKDENGKQLVGAHEASVATVSAIDEAQKTTSTGKLPVKELDTAKKTATITKDALDAATGTVVDPARVRELELMVTNLNAGIAAGATALASMQSALDLSIAREKELEAQKTKIEAAAKTKIEAAEAKVENVQGVANKWALERDSIARRFENFKFWGFIIVGGIAFLWVSATFLPLFTKAFPALEPFARVAGSIWSGGLQKAHNEATRLNEDFVAMTEVLKAKIAKHATPEEIEALKAEIKNDWMTAHDGSAEAIERIKAKLRL